MTDPRRIDDAPTPFSIYTAARLLTKADLLEGRIILNADYNYDCQCHCLHFIFKKFYSKDRRNSKYQLKNATIKNLHNFYKKLIVKK